MAEREHPPPNVNTCEHLVNTCSRGHDPPTAPTRPARISGSVNTPSGGKGGPARGLVSRNSVHMFTEWSSSPSRPAVFSREHLFTGCSRVFTSEPRLWRGRRRSRSRPSGPRHGVMTAVRSGASSRRDGPGHQNHPPHADT